MKCATFAEAVARYGTVDIPTCHWPDGGKWLQMFEIPSGFESWMLLASDKPVKHLMINSDAIEPLTLALQAIKAQGLASQLKTFDGCFNIRLVRGSLTEVSVHSYGLALDINAGENKLGQTSGGLFDQMPLVKCFCDQGWNWGGLFSERKDPQHFSFAWE